MKFKNLFDHFYLIKGSFHTQDNRDEMFTEVEKQTKVFESKLSLLDTHLILQKPFTAKQVKANAAEILVSFKVGEKGATLCIGRNIFWACPKKKSALP